MLVKDRLYFREGRKRDRERKFLYFITPRAARYLILTYERDFRNRLKIMQSFLVVNDNAAEAEIELTTVLLKR